MYAHYLLYCNFYCSPAKFLLYCSLTWFSKDGSPPQFFGAGDATVVESLFAVSYRPPVSPNSVHWHVHTNWRNIWNFSRVGGGVLPLRLRQGQDDHDEGSRCRRPLRRTESNRVGIEGDDERCQFEWVIGNPELFLVVGLCDERECYWYSKVLNGYWEVYWSCFMRVVIHIGMVWWNDWYRWCHSFKNHEVFPNHITMFTPMNI